MFLSCKKGFECNVASPRKVSSVEGCHDHEQREDCQSPKAEPRCASSPRTTRGPFRSGSRSPRLFRARAGTCNRRPRSPKVINIGSPYSVHVFEGLSIALAMLGLRVVMRGTRCLPVPRLDPTGIHDIRADQQQSSGCARPGGRAHSHATNAGTAKEADGVQSSTHGHGQWPGPSLLSHRSRLTTKCLAASSTGK